MHPEGQEVGMHLVDQEVGMHLEDQVVGIALEDITFLLFKLFMIFSSLIYSV